jgi:DNA-binding winged helix-turn-helix (wHTH) protein/tetratricopeptide (TPR) repeat protein
MDARAPPSPTYRFGDYRLTPDSMQLERAGEPIPVTPRVFHTILYLVENAGRTVSKDEMLNAIWPGRIADEANLSKAVSAARQIFAADPAAGGLIVTIPGRGYRFTSPVSIEAPTRPEAQEDDPPIASPEPIAHRRAWPFAFGAVCVALLAIAAALTTTRKPPSQPSAIVLADLQNFTGEPVFNHVIPRMLQIDLAQSPYLRIASDTQIAETLKLMEQAKDATLTPALALAVCARTNANTLIVPVIANLGGRYVLTLTASSCATSKALFDDKQEAPDKEGIPHALDVLSARMRRRLGEVGASIARFDVPLVAARTGSFAALRAYSEGEWLSRQGKRLDAIPLYQHAVELDPDFAAAYLALSQSYYATHQPLQDAAAIAKAYEKRAFVSEPEALLIENRYNMTVTKNLDAALKSVTLMTRLYPSDAVAWSSLSNLQFRMGAYEDALAAGQRALDADPHRSPSYTVLARVLIRMGQFARAETLEALALREAPESGQVRQQRIALRYLQGDEAGAERLVASAAGTPLEREALLESYNFAVAHGRLRRAAELLDRADLLGQPMGLQRNLAVEAFNDALLGRAEEGRAALAKIPATLWTGEYDYYLALLKDRATAEAQLARDLARWPNDTLLHAKYAPETRAALLLKAGKPKEAVRALDAAARFMVVDLDAPCLRASALLAQGDGVAAAAAYRAILAHPGFRWDAQYWLAHLGLARALRVSGKLQDSRREYETFLTAWREADPDLAPVRQAKAEYAALRAGPVPSQ